MEIALSGNSRHFHTLKNIAPTELSVWEDVQITLEPACIIYNNAVYRQIAEFLNVTHTLVTALYHHYVHGFLTIVTKIRI